MKKTTNLCMEFKKILLIIILLLNIQNLQAGSSNSDEKELQDFIKSIVIEETDSEIKLKAYRYGLNVEEYKQKSIEDTINRKKVQIKLYKECISQKYKESICACNKRIYGVSNKASYNGEWLYNNAKKDLTGGQTFKSLFNYGIKFCTEIEEEEKQNKSK